MPPKSIEDYIKDIKSKHNEIETYPTPKTQKQEEELEALKKQLDTQLRGWVKKLNITVFVAQNEQLEWTAEELKGFTIKPMMLKSDCGYDQVGDYQAYFSGGGVAGWIPILVERKGGKRGCEDLYGTLINKERCKTFYDELNRFYKDDRFTQMIVITECTLPQYLLYVPLFNGKRRNVNHVGASVESRGGKIDSLFLRGVPVLFAGTRKQAIQRYQGLLKQWLMKNYVSILRLDKRPYNDKLELERRIAFKEAELLALRGSLEVMEAHT